MTHFLSKNVYFNICHCKNSKVIAGDKFQKFGVDTPVKDTVVCMTIDQLPKYPNWTFIADDTVTCYAWSVIALVQLWY